MPIVNSERRRDIYSTEADDASQSRSPVQFRVTQNMGWAAGWAGVFHLRIGLISASFDCSIMTPDYSALVPLDYTYVLCKPFVQFLSQCN